MAEVVLVFLGGIDSALPTIYDRIAPPRFLQKDGQYKRTHAGAEPTGPATLRPCFLAIISLFERKSSVFEGRSVGSPKGLAEYHPARLDTPSPF